MESDEDSDQIYDEIDRYYMSLNMPNDGEEGESVKRWRPEEVLNVDGEDDLSDDNDNDEKNDNESDGAFSDSDSDVNNNLNNVEKCKFSDSDSDVNNNLNNVEKCKFSDSDSDVNNNLNNVEKLLPSADKWGSDRKSFYNTSYVDDDWGGMNEGEAELAELEEEDAIVRQRKLDAALNYVPIDFQDEIQEEEIICAVNEPLDLSSLSVEEQLQYFLKNNLDFKQIYAEYQQQRSYFMDNVLPLLDTARALNRFRKDLVLGKQLLLVVNVFSRYLTNLLFAIHIKITESSSQESLQFVDHPVLQAVSIFRKEVSTVMRFLDREKAALRRVRDKMQSSNYRDFLDVFPTLESIQKLRKSSEKDQKEQQAIEEEEGVVDGDDVPAGDNIEGEITKRLITSQIEKNKGLQNRRKKGTQHSRVKKRKQFRKAMIKKRSQTPNVRKELTPYGGESRGIRASTVKSVKLKA